MLDGTVENLSTDEETTRSLEIITGFYVFPHIGGQVPVPLARPLRDVSVTSW